MGFDHVDQKCSLLMRVPGQKIQCPGGFRFLRLGPFMAPGKSNDQYGSEETERLQKILQGAFNGPPTPLKDIPKRNGESRSLERKKPQRRRRQRLKHDSQS
jgi:hypothetical protein